MTSQHPNAGDNSKLSRRLAQVRHRAYHTVGGLIHYDPAEHRLTLRMVLKWLLLGGGVGILSGTASAAFLASLAWATNFRERHSVIIIFLPIAGLLLGWTYHRYAGEAARGNNLIIDELHTNSKPIPARMAPMILLGTIVTHLFGGSAGREGTAVQMGASLADWFRRSLSRYVQLSADDRRMILMAGVSGGFSSVFGTPIAGFVFSLEVQSLGRIRYDGLLPCLISAIVGDLVAHAWGIAHTPETPLINLPLEPLTLIKVIGAGIVFGLVGLLFIELTHGIKHAAQSLIKRPPLRPFIGGLMVLGLIVFVGSTDYIGLSLPLLRASLDGTGVPTFAFLLKLVFTAVTLGMGFVGGEVTPLFVIGATCGYTLAKLFGVSPTLLAPVGYVAVFAGASNTPMACTLMGIELFGGGSAIYVILGAFTAYLVSGHRSIYSAQRIGIPKISGLILPTDQSLESMAKRPRHTASAQPDVTNLASRLIDSMKQSLLDSRYIVGIVGPPGAGKSTLAAALCEAVNAQLPHATVVVPMDGFHLPNRIVKPQGLHPFKGIPATFDAAGFVSLLRQLRAEPRQTVLCPAFDRGIDDPVENAITVTPDHRLVIVEGNYLLLDNPYWDQIPPLLDESWYLSVDRDVMYQRLIERHMAGGRSHAEAEAKIQSTDLINADLIEGTRSRATLIIER